jgi:hypothetical protein
MASLARLRELPKLTTRPVGRLHCDLDDWDFDPRYTDGACPICGWRPDYEAVPRPAWLETLDRVPWDYVSLGVVFCVLAALGVIVGLAAHINLATR